MRNILQNFQKCVCVCVCVCVNVGAGSGVLWEVGSGEIFSACHSAFQYHRQKPKRSGG